MFDSIHKNPIPKYPKSVGVITSLTGAALRDFLDVMNRRAPHIEIIIYPTLVQGEGAAKSISNAINEINRLDLVDLIVITRGGGSIEDLWAFNEKIVAEMIFKSSIPIVSAIGHETDFTISDFISDLRAATPSVAAELISVSKERIIENLSVLKSRLNKKIENILNTLSLDFDYFEKILISNKPETKIKLQLEKVHNVKSLIINLMKQKIDEVKIELKIAENQLQSYNPENILKRGYSIALDDKGLPLKDSKKINTDDIFSLILNKGKIRAKKSLIRGNMAKKQKFNIEKSLEDLNQIVKKMEHENGTLEDNLKYYEQGINLIKKCQKELEIAKQKVSILNQQSDDEVELKDFE